MEAAAQNVVTHQRFTLSAFRSQFVAGPPLPHPGSCGRRSQATEHKPVREVANVELVVFCEMGAGPPGHFFKQLD